MLQTTAPFINVTPAQIRELNPEEPLPYKVFAVSAIHFYNLAVTRGIANDTEIFVKIYKYLRTDFALFDLRDHLDYVKLHISSAVHLNLFHPGDISWDRPVSLYV